MEIQNTSYNMKSRLKKNNTLKFRPHLTYHSTKHQHETLRYRTVVINRTAYPNLTIRGFATTRHVLSWCIKMRGRIEH